MSAGFPPGEQETLSYPKPDTESHMNDYSISLAK